jgi:Tol biopolymer transport system component/DNA-binding winged helix-turn-helix (wHTH) protein
MNQKRLYEFDGYVLDSDQRILLRDGVIVSLTQKAFEVLYRLVQRHGRIVSKEELMNEVWPETFVEEGNLAQNIYTLRKVLGESSTGDDYIQTVPRRGYRFSAEVRESEPNEIEIPTAEVLRLVELKREKLGLGFFSPAEGVIETPAPVPVDNSNQGPPWIERAEEKPPPPTSTIAEAHQRPEKSHKPKVSRGLKIGMGIALTVLLAGLGSWKFVGSRSSAKRFSRIVLSNLSTAGNIQCLALSPDGKYIVYGVAERPNLSSLQVMQLSTSTSQTVIPPSETVYHALTISPDGGYIYFIKLRKDNTNRELHRVPLLGGVSTKLSENVETRVAFSPDGKQIAYRRGDNNRRLSILYLANADGSAEQAIASLKFPETFSDPAWSPNGRMIAAAAGHSHGGRNRYVFAITIANQAVQTLLNERWQWIGQMQWLPGSDSLILVGSRDGSDPGQLWRLDYPSGMLAKITNDAINYNRLSMSADGTIIAAMQQKLSSSLWTGPAQEPAKAQSVSIGVGGYRGKLSWTPDNRIVFDSESGNVTTISVMNADGSNRKQLTGDLPRTAVIGYATATPDGRSIVYFSDLTGARQIWRMNLDGSNQTQLTFGQGEDHPACSPDGKWVVYSQQERPGEGKPSLWRVPIDGGKSERLTDDFTDYPAVSPDGKLLACLRSSSTNSPWQLALYSNEDRRFLKDFPQPIQGTPYIRWTPDGRGLTYAENRLGPSKLWLQPIAGGPPRVALSVEPEEIHGFDWSRDGKMLAYVRAFWSLNMVRIDDVKE